MSIRALTTLSGVAAGLLVATWGCARESRPVADVPVFIISIDTLRADRLPAYGYATGSTPAIDRLRADSILFERAYSHVPLTLPSHASLFTGELPADHGVRDNIGYRLDGDSTIARQLLDRGYATGAAVSTWVLRRDTGIESGFEFYDDETDPSRDGRGRSEERDGDRSRIALSGWLARQRGARVFGFLHLFEPHAPYEPPAPFDASGDAYDGEVSRADAIVGLFLDELRARGLYDRAMIVLLSDHGEGLGDHGEDEHGVFLYRESIHVPLLLKLPGGERKGESVSRPVGLIDVAPTVMSVTGAGDASRFPGTVLTLDDATPRTLVAETYFPRLHLGWSELFAAVDGTYHYIDAPRAELYAVSDLRQESNILDQQRRAAFAMRSKLEAIDWKFTVPSSVDPEDAKRLAALGYLGSSRIDAGPLPDPKDHISSIRALKQALELFHRGELTAAHRSADALLADHPQMVDGWLLKATVERGMGRGEDALSTTRAALQRFPTHPDLLLSAAELLLERGDHEGASGHAELARSVDRVAAGEMLARIAIARDDAAGAETHIRSIGSEASLRPSTLLILADALKRQRRFAEELGAIDRAIAGLTDRRMEPVERIQYERGLALLELRRPSEAAAAFREEVRVFPGNLDAWGMLAVARTLEGDHVDGGRVLDEMVRINPGPDAQKLAAETRRVIERRF